MIKESNEELNSSPLYQSGNNFCRFDLQLCKLGISWLFLMFIQHLTDN